MKTYTINCADISSREALYTALEETLALPEYFGRNLDALYDCLMEIGEDTHLQLTHFDALESTLGGYADKVKLVLDDVSKENLCFHYSID